MIDWISGFLPCTHTPLKAGYVCSVSPVGEVEWQTPKRTQVSGSFEQNITVKSDGSHGDGTASHLYFSGNPSKFLQGHNIFGSDDLISLMVDTYQRVCLALDITPSQEDQEAMRFGRYDLTRVDINYSYDLPTRSDVLAFLRALEFKSKTRHGRPSSKGGTLYWGKTSKRWSLKAYSKGEEIEVVKHRLPDSLVGTPLAQWADNKLRLEVVLRSKELEEIRLRKACNWSKNSASKIFKDYLSRLDMNEQIALTDKQLLDLPQRLRSTYHLWKGGYDLRSELPKRTYYRHRKDLLAYGINIDLRKECADQSNVIPIVRVLEAQPAELPGWAFDMQLIHHSAYDQPSRHLRAVS